MDHIEQTIVEMKQRIAEKENELAEAKRSVNSFCKLMQRPPIYQDVDAPQAAPHVELRGDEYYQQPLATAITSILERRKAGHDGPATVKEIFQALVAGGYQFETKSDANSMRGIRISMRKNRKFHRLPNGKWGLREWYPGLKETKSLADEAKANANDVDIEEVSLQEPENLADQGKQATDME